ncbi:hypothetical protein RRG08_040728 [Elysia crispata]|uniref:Uncharacterized protein n=1 Tax=Elysia crispata TaxID=231223 RepID=A0AAE1BDD4_9GAST|nr:hypothetical protein RRG08_040728 [Elysia crispata]
MVEDSDVLYNYNVRTARKQLKPLSFWNINSSLGDNMLQMKRKTCFQHRENSHDQQHHVLSEPFTALHENLERSAPAPTGAFLHKTYRGSTVETRVIAGRPGHRTPGRTPNAAQVRVNTQICSYSQVTNSSLRYARLTTERIPCGHFASVLTLHAAQ